MCSTPYTTHNATPQQQLVFRERSSVWPVVQAFLSCGKLAVVVQIAAAGQSL